MLMRSLITLFIGVLLADLVCGQDVSTAVSTRETYVGVPVVLEIRLSNTADPTGPEFAEVDGLKIESAGPPSRRMSSSTTIDSTGRQRRTTSSTVVFRYLVTPEREGTFTIPPVKVSAGRLSTITKAIRIVATKSETSDLLFVEITGDRKQVYVGEPITLTLKMWIRPYRNREHQITLTEGDMWNSLASATNWGPFTKRFEELDQERKRPGGDSVLRQVPTDADDPTSEPVEREYYLYEVDATIYPDRPGKIDASDLRVVVDYPVELSRRGGGFFDDSMFSGFPGFGPRLSISKTRPIVAQASVDAIEVQPIPTADRPADYQGAVGKYSIIAEAVPRKVKVGDPITLHMAIDGDGPMELVRAPNLSAQTALTKDFKVSDEPLAGIVDGSRKLFTTTIRPRRDGITEIPPITYTYFDPQSGTFVTKQSQPISIEVQQGEVLALDAIVGARGNNGFTSTPDSASESNSKSAAPDQPTLSLFTSDEALASTKPSGLIDDRWWVWLWGPPLLALLAALFNSRRRFGLLASGLVSAQRRFRSELDSAESPPEVTVALQRFLARRLRIPADFTDEQTLGRLRASGQADLAIRVERLQSLAAKSTSGLSNADATESLKQEAIEIAEELSSRSITPQGRTGRLSATSATLLFLLANVASAAPTTEELTTAQIESLWQTAVNDYQTVAASTQAPAAQQSAFASVAQKFQLLADEGIRNPQLFFNLANSQMQANQRGKAIANYRRALRLDPTNDLYRRNLVHVEQELNLPATESRFAKVGEINDVFLSFVTLEWVIRSFFLAWILFWSAIALRTFGVKFPWKSIATIAGLLIVVTGCSYWLRVSPLVADAQAILISNDIVVHEGDGNEFPEVTTLGSSEGRAVAVLSQRGEWVRIATANTEGWVAAASLELIGD